MCSWLAWPRAAEAQAQPAAGDPAGEAGLAAEEHEQPLEPDRLARAHVRGRPVGEGPGATDPLYEDRLVEAAPLPADASTPWLAEPPPAAGRSPARAAGPPDRSWLSELQLPDLPVRWDPRVIEFLEFYKDDPRGRSIMAAWLRDQGKYRDLILARLRRAGLPEDLLYVCMIESSYDPRELSWAGASGLWQFMPAGGRVYGLRIDHWVDERNDPVRATDAVLLYWADLYQRFGNWDLAMAAFNAGYAAVLRSIAKYNTNDFWQLLEYENGLPYGSRVYVPKALAAAIVGHNRARFGFDRVAAAPPLAWDTVTVSQSVSLQVIAKAAGVDVGAVAALNPHLRRQRTPPGSDRFAVRIPVGRGAGFAERLAALRSEWAPYETYVVSHGERFEDIATLHGISTAALRRLNGIEHESEVQGGMALVVPEVSAEAKRRNHEKAMDDLYAGGHPGGKAGDPLFVAVPDRALSVAGRRRVFYRVVAGDSQSKVADAFGVDRADLAAWNGLDPEGYLHPRMVLQLFVDPALDLAAAHLAVLDEERLVVVDRGSAQHLDLSEERAGRKRVVYRASRRESFADVAARYGLADHDLARINRRPKNTVLEPGEEIVVYQVVEPTRSRRAAEQAERASRHAAAEKKAAEKKAAEKKTREKKAGEKRTAEKQTAEKPASEKKASEKKTAEKETAEKKSAEKKSARR